MPASKKAMEQKQKTGSKVVQREKAPKKINNGLLDQHKHDNYNINE